MTHSREWAMRRGLLKKFEIHGAEEWRVATSSSFRFTESSTRVSEGEAAFQVEDDGSFLDGSFLSSEAALRPVSSTKAKLT